MNREQAKGVVKHFEAVKAFAEGKPIQRKPPLEEEWHDVNPSDGPQFSQDFEYRVKPEPRTIRVWFRKDGLVAAQRDSWDDRLDDPKNYFTDNSTLVEFVEVIKS